MDERNLTKEMRLAFLVPVLGHKPGHDVVVVDQEGGQRPRLLGPGEGPKRGWFRKTVSTVAYAVPNAPNLRHDFSRPGQTVDQQHSFTLHYRVEFRIAAPVVLVERLASDPLQRLEDEVHSLLGGKVRLLAWEAIVEEGEDLGERLLLEADAERSDGPSLLHRLQAFASHLGFDVSWIALSRTLPETETVVRRNVEATKRDVMDLEHETYVHGEGLQLEKEMLAERRKINAAKGAAVRTWVGAVGDQGAVVVENAVRGIQDFPGIQGAFEVMVQAARILEGTGGAPELALPGASTRALSAADAKAFGSLQGLLGDLALEFAKLPCPGPERRRLMSAALHLIAELLLDTSDGVATYRDTIDGAFREYADKLAIEQNKLFKRLRDVEALRLELSS
jgi:hypothetical protein